MAWVAGERVILRAWERDDVAACWEASQTADALGQRLRDWHEPPESLHQMELEFESWASDPDATVARMIIEAAGRPVGDIDLFHIDHRNRNALIGVGIWRAEDRNKGYGTDAIRAMIRWGFRHLNLHRIELAVEPDNASAMHVYEKIGFVSEGRRREHHYDDGCYRDEEVMGILRREFEAREHAAT